jgi:hypothetical protein
MSDTDGAASATFTLTVNTSGGGGGVIAITLDGVGKTGSSATFTNVTKGNHHVQAQNGSDPQVDQDVYVDHDMTITINLPHP